MNPETTNQPRNPSWAYWALLLSLLLALLLSREAFASSAVGINNPLNDTQPTPNTPIIDGEGGTESGDDADEDSANKNSEETGSGTSITNYQHNEYYFDTTSWISALLQTLNRDSSKSANKYRPILKEAVRSALGMLIDFGTDGLNGISRGQLAEPSRRIWKVSFGIALALFPLVMVVNVFLVYSQGLGAGVARVEMLHNLIEGMVLMGFAWGSYILINYVISIGWGLSSLIMEVNISGAANGKYAVVEQIAADIVRIASSNFPGLIFFYLTVFFLIFGFMLLGALKLSYYAIIVVAVMCVVIAPIVIVLGGIPQFKWLYGMWMRILSGVLLLPIFNALMIRLWATLSRSGSSNNFLIVITNLGLLSILIAINGKVGQFTFGPALEAGKKALGATLMVGKLLVSAVAVAAGGSGAFPAASGIMSGGGGGSGKNGSASGVGDIQAGEGPSASAASISRGKPSYAKPGYQAGGTFPAPSGKNDHRILAGDILFRPGKIAKAAAEGRISPEQMNRLALAGKLTETMFRNDPVMRTLTTPMRHGIDGGIQAQRPGGNGPWPQPPRAGSDKNSLWRDPENTYGSPADVPRNMMPSRSAFSNAMLNYENPFDSAIQPPEGFLDLSDQAYNTVERMTLAAQTKGVDPFAGLPQDVTREQFAAAAGYLLSPVGITARIDSPGQNPMNQVAANNILQQVQRFSSGGASSVSAALQETVRDIEEGVLTQLDPQSLINQFSKNLSQARNDKNLSQS